MPWSLFVSALLYTFMQSLTLVSRSSTYAISVTDIMTHLNIIDSSQQPYVQTLLDAAVSYCESETGLDWRPCTWNLVLDQFPVWGQYDFRNRYGDWYGGWPWTSEQAVGRVTQTWQAINLQRGPTVSVNSIKYYDASNTLQTVNPTTYSYTTPTNLPGTLEPTVYWQVAYPRPDAVTINMTTGYTASGVTALPANGIHALKLLCGLWYSMREDIAYGAGTASGATGQAVSRLLGQFAMGSYA